MHAVASQMLAPARLLSRRVARRASTSPMRLAMKGARRKYVANVEQLHVPDLSEEVNVLAIGALSFARVTTIGFFFASLVRFGARMTEARAKPLGWALGAFALMIVGESFVYGDVNAPLVRNRDISMARYIDQWIRTDASGAPLLVIVGRAHLTNIGRFLSESYGFAEVPIDEAHLARIAGSVTP